MIYYGQQHITKSDIDAVITVLNSINLTQGPNIPAFEDAVASYTGAKYSIAVNSATSALHISCLALGLEKNDIVWTTTNSFVATANCALYCGASVDFLDIDPLTYNICTKKLAIKLAGAALVGQLPKIVIPVHLAGQPCDMESIYNLSIKYGFKIIEDASHAIGGKYKDKPIGSSIYSDITVFSFHPVKIITTGEGGMALTNNAALATRLSLLRSHGITRNSKLMTEAMHGPWYYQQVDLGYNYRITDIQAALGVSQMKRLDQYIQIRHEIAQRYNKLLDGLPITLPWQHPDSYSAYHLYIIRLQLNKINTSHLDVFNGLRSKDIMVNLHYIPIHTQPYFQKMGFNYGDYPEAEQYYREAISIPIHPTLSLEEQSYVVNSIREVIGL